MLPEYSFEALIWRIHPTKYEAEVRPHAGNIVVLGKYDRMALRKLEAWQEVGRVPLHDDMRGFATSLTLFPLPSQGTLPREMADVLLKIGTDQPIDDVVVFIQIQLSPAIHKCPDLCQSLSLADRVVYRDLSEVVLAHWRSMCDVAAHCAYHTFSWPDVVIAVRASSDADLAKIYEAARVMSGLRIHQLLSNGVDLCGGVNDRGHAFTTVVPVTALSTRFAASGQGWHHNTTLRFETVIVPECGHSSKITARIRDLSGVSVEGGRYGVAGHSVVAYSNGLASWRRLWDALSGDAAWFQGNVLDMQSSPVDVLADPDVGDWQSEREWRLADELVVQLEEIEAGLETTRHFLGDEPHHAVMEVFSSFRQSFHSVHLVSSCADLIPFFAEFATLCRHIDQYRIEGTEINKWVADVVQCLHVAIQNRTEHTVAGGRIGLLTGPEQAAIKLFSAYSEMVRLCLLLAENWVKHRQKDVTATHVPRISACLLMGRSGYMQTLEPLEKIRTKLAELSVGCGCAIAIDVSGSLFTAPSFAPLKVLHEISEAGGLLAYPGFSRERYAINSWICEFVSQILAQDIIRAWGGSGPLPSMASEMARLVAQAFLVLVIPFDLQAPNGSFETLRRDLRKMRTECDPVVFCKLLNARLDGSAKTQRIIQQSFKEIVGSEEFKQSPVGKVMYSPAPGVDHAYITVQSPMVRAESARITNAEGSSLVADVVADYSTLTLAGVISPDGRRRHAYFLGLVDAACRAFGPKSQALKGVIVRWAVFHVISGREDSERVEMAAALKKATGFSEQGVSGLILFGLRHPMVLGQDSILQSWTMDHVWAEDRPILPKRDNHLLSELLLHGESSPVQVLLDLHGCSLSSSGGGGFQGV